MSEMLRIKGMSPFDLNMHNRIIRVSYSPTSFIYNEDIGLHSTWNISDLTIASKIIEGPFKVKYEENGEIRKKQRYNVMIWPEICYTPSKDVVEFLEESNSKDPPCDTVINLKCRDNLDYEKLEKKAAAIYFERKNQNGGDNQTATDRFTVFKPGELGEGRTETFRSFGEIGDMCFKLCCRILRSTVGKFNGGKAYAVRRERHFSSPEAVEEVKKCMKVVKTSTDDFYLADYWPWCLGENDLKKPFWKLMHKFLGYKKLTLTTLTCDLDLKDYLKVKKKREEELLEMQERMRIFMSRERGL